MIGLEDDSAEWLTGAEQDVKLAASANTGITSHSITDEQVMTKVFSP